MGLLAAFIEKVGHSYALASDGARGLLKSFFPSRRWSIDRRRREGDAQNRGAFELGKVGIWRGQSRKKKGSRRRRSLEKGDSPLSEGVRIHNTRSHFARGDGSKPRAAMTDVSRVYTLAELHGLTVPQLRVLAASHNVSIPCSVRKAERITTLHGVIGDKSSDTLPDDRGDTPSDRASVVLNKLSKESLRALAVDSGLRDAPTASSKTELLKFVLSPDRLCKVDIDDAERRVAEKRKIIASKRTKGKLATKSVRQKLDLFRGAELCGGGGEGSLRSIAELRVGREACLLDVRPGRGVSLDVMYDDVIGGFVHLETEFVFGDAGCNTVIGRRLGARIVDLSGDETDTCKGLGLAFTVARNLDAITGERMSRLRVEELVPMLHEEEDGVQPDGHVTSMVDADLDYEEDADPGNESEECEAERLGDAEDCGPDALNGYESMEEDPMDE